MANIFGHAAVPTDATAGPSAGEDEPVRGLFRLRALIERTNGVARHNRRRNGVQPTRTSDWRREPTWVVSGMTPERGYGVPPSINVDALSSAQLGVLLRLGYLTADLLTEEQRESVSKVQPSEIAAVAGSMMGSLADAYKRASAG